MMPGASCKTCRKRPAALLRQVSLAVPCRACPAGVQGTCLCWMPPQAPARWRLAVLPPARHCRLRPRLEAMTDHFCKDETEGGLSSTYQVFMVRGACIWLACRLDCPAAHLALPRRSLAPALHPCCSSHPLQTHGVSERNYSRAECQREVRLAVQRFLSFDWSRMSKWDAAQVRAGQGRALGSLRRSLPCCHVLF